MTSFAHLDPADPQRRAGPPRRAALLLSADPTLVLEVERYAAAAGACLDTTADPAVAARAWGQVAVALVGADLAPDLVGHGLPRREDTYLVSTGTAGDACFRWAVGLGAAAVLELPEASDWLVGALTDLESRASATTVAVVGGSGGVGASSLAATLALRAGRSGPVTLVDLDPDGPGVQRLVGLEDGDGVTWHELASSHGRLGAAALRSSLPATGEVRVLGWPTGAGAGQRLDPGPVAVGEALAAARRGSDWVVLDLPRGGIPQLVGPRPEPIDHVVVVVRPTVTGVASAVRALERVTVLGAPVGLVVRARRGSPLTREVATALRQPVLAELPDHRRLDEHLDLGLGPAHDRRNPFVGAADTVLRGWKA